MNPGDLVKITRPSIGTPKGAIGVITSHHRKTPLRDDLHLFDVHLLACPEWGTRTRRCLSRDLELISENAALWTSAKTAEA